MRRNRFAWPSKCIPAAPDGMLSDLNGLSEVLGVGWAANGRSMGTSKNLTTLSLGKIASS